VAQVIALLAIIAGCTGCVTTNPAPIEDPRTVWCHHNSPRRDATMATPRAEIDEINAHNLKGVKWCGWMP
jgi:hypothetical protein